MKNSKIYDMTLIGLMAAIICIVAPFSVPLSFTPVPISLANLAIYISAGILGSKKGSVSVIIYLLLGAVGVPVYAGWTAGFQRIAGPTGGYLIGFIFIALITGFFIEKFEGKLYMYAAGMILGTLVCYLIGSAWLSMEMKLSFSKALLLGVIPYIPGDAVKIVLASILTYSLRVRLRASNLLKSN